LFKKRKRGTKIIVSIALALMLLVIMASAFIGILRKNPKLRLLLGLYYMTAETMSDEDFLLYEFPLAEVISDYVNGDTESTGQIRLSGIKGLDLTLALNYRAQRAVSIGQGKVDVSAEIMRFPAGDLTLYAKGDTLYTSAPVLDEPIALKTDVDLFPVITELSETMDTAWFKRHWKDLWELQGETAVTQEAETGRFCVEVSAAGVRQVFSMLGIECGLKSPEPFTFSVDLNAENRIRGVTMTLPETICPYTTLSLEGEALGKLTIVYDAPEKHPFEIILERSPQDERTIQASGKCSDYSFSGSFSWEKKGEDEGYRVSLEKFKILQDVDTLIQIDADSEMKLLLEKPDTLFDDGFDFSAAKEWNPAELRERISESMTNMKETLKGAGELLEKFW